MRALRRINPIGAFMLALLIVIACVIPQPETPGQRWYGTKVAYLVALETAGDYCVQPTSDSRWCQRAAQRVLAADKIVAMGDKALLGPHGGGDILAFIDALEAITLFMGALPLDANEEI